MRMLDQQPSTVLLRRENGSTWFAAAVIAVLAICIALVAYSHSLFTAAEQLTAENGTLENLQQLMLAVTGVAFAVAMYSTSSTHPKSRCLMLVALCITFLLRETDVPVPNDVAWLSYWIDESGKKILLAVTWLAAIGYLANQGPVASWWSRNGVLDGTFWTLGLSAGLLFVGWAYDRGHLLSKHSLLIEEQCECIGYALMFVSVFARRRPRLHSLPGVQSDSVDSVNATQHGDVRKAA